MRVMNIKIKRAWTELVQLILSISNLRDSHVLRGGVYFI